MTTTDAPEGDAPEGDAPEGLRLTSGPGRWVLFATVLGSGIVMIDGTVVNIALPAIGRDLDAGVAGLQWTVNGYTLTLAAFILLGGSLGDHFGRRRVFVVGVAWFAVASLLCGLAPSIELLIAGRVLQGIGGALLTPGSLAIISSSFAPGDRGRAIGAWSGLGGIASALGPFLGGWLTELDWHLVFLVNLPLAALTIAVALKHVPDTRDQEAGPSTGMRGLDPWGALLAVAALGGITAALTETSAGAVVVWVAAVVGVAGAVGFVVVERRGRHPMVPLEIFANRQFSAVNLVTLGLYAALGGVFFLLVLDLQVVAGFSPLSAGTSLLPLTVVMLLFSARSGALAARIGVRRPMTAGPLICAVGTLLYLRVGPDANYFTTVLPGVLVFAVGLCLTVAPLTVTALGSVPDRHAGVASGVNNAVARAGGLLAVAVLPLATGLTGDAYRDPARFDTAFDHGLMICAALCAASGVVAGLLIRDEAVTGVAAPTGATTEAGADADAPAAVGGAPVPPCSPGAVPCAPPVAVARESRRA